MTRSRTSPSDLLEVAGPYDDEFMVGSMEFVLTHSRFGTDAELLDAIERMLTLRANRIYSYTPRVAQ